MAKVLVACCARSSAIESSANAVADGTSQEGAVVRMRRARVFVSSEVMAKVPGWMGSAERMNASVVSPQ